MFSSLIEGAAFKASSSNATQIFNQFNSSTFLSAAELFIEAP